MITIQRLAEKQDKINKKEKLIRKLMGITLIIGIIVFLTIILFNAPIYIGLAVVFVFAGLLIASFVNIFHSQNVTCGIIRSIERILDSVVESELPDNELVIVSCEKSTDSYLYFLVEIYGDTLSYESLAHLVEPIVNDINKIIHPTLYVYYRIEKEEDDSEI